MFKVLKFFKGDFKYEKVQKMLLVTQTDVGTNQGVV